MSPRKLKLNGNISNRNPLYLHMASLPPLRMSSSDQHSQSIPVKPSNHLLAHSIPMEHIQKNQLLCSHTATSTDSLITSYTGIANPYVSHTSFHNLLTYGCPIDDSIFFSKKIQFLRVSYPDCHAVGTNFHRFFYHYGWETAFRKFFIHSQTSKPFQKVQRYTVPKFYNHSDSNSYTWLPLGCSCLGKNLG